MKNKRNIVQDIFGIQSSYSKFEQIRDLTKFWCYPNFDDSNVTGVH